LREKHEFAALKKSLSWSKAHWKAIRRIAAVVFILFVVGLLTTLVLRVDWGAVWAAVGGYGTAQLARAGLVVMCSYIVYSSFDLLGKRYTEHKLDWWRPMLVGFVSYAFTLNLGAPVGGVGLRLRLYDKMGLQPGIAVRVMALSLATNWVGYLLLAGAIFALGKISLPAAWGIGAAPMRIAGVVMLAAACSYLALCAFSPTRSRMVHGHEIELPTLGLALTQVSVAILNWSLIAAVIYALMPHGIGYFEVMGALFISAVAGLITHIPGGLGVTEAVFVALLSSSGSRFEILGAMLVFRALYYLAPLLLAAIFYLGMEAKIRKPRLYRSRKRLHDCPKP
jgi:uncharacterized membrane protein YbhN (UPF0104 family)